MADMTKRERVLAAVKGAAVDRPPVSFWYHFSYVDDPWGETLAREELAFYEKYDIDFIKVMHDIPYQLPDGMERVADPSDWNRLDPLNPRRGSFAKQLDALRRILAGKKDDGIVINNLFSPYAYAHRVCGRELPRYIEADMGALQVGLETITESLISFAKAAIEDGIDGIYLAALGPSPDQTTREIYRREFLPWDRKVLEAVKDLGAFNVLHIHGEEIYFDLFLDLPFHALCWSNKLTPPSFTEARDRYGYKGCVIGGLHEFAIKEKTPEEVTAEAQEAIDETGGRSAVIAPGCAVPTDTPEANLLALRRAVEM
jgi:uroporphyrinogen decarboxylase